MPTTSIHSPRPAPSAPASMCPAGQPPNQRRRLRLQFTAPLRSLLEVPPHIPPPARPVYEIAFILEGKANGWTFPATVLQASAPLWENCRVMIDHSLWQRSFRDLGGVLQNIAWSSGHNGLTAHLIPVGPSGQIVVEAARFMLEPGPKPDLGFSADLIFTADPSNTVQRIVRPLSVDLVMDPAFATKFIRQLNSRGAAISAAAAPHYPAPVSSHPYPPKGVPMSAQAGSPNPSVPQDQSSVPSDASQLHPLQQHPSGTDSELLAAHREAIQERAEAEQQRELLLVQQHELDARRQLQAEQEAARAARIEICNNLLESSLLAAELPEAATRDIRLRFSDRVFRPAELKEAIKNWRDSLAEITSVEDIRGPVRFSSMFDSADQVQAAIDDLLASPRDKGAETLQAHKFSGIREAYLWLTGDYDFVGGYHRDRVQFQHATVNFPGLLKNALNKSMVNHWSRFGKAGYDWWKKVVTVEHFDSLQDVTWLIFGTIGSLPQVLEGAEYTELRIGDSPEVSSWQKYGGYLGITLEAMMRDDTRKLRAAPREVSLAGLRNISRVFAAFFTASAGAGPTMADGGALLNANVVTTAGGHANLLTTALGTDYTAWNAVAAAVYNQPMLVANEDGLYGTGAQMAIDPRFCLVPRALKAQAEALFVPRWSSSVESIASAGGPSYGGFVEPVVVPEWTDANDWAAVVDPTLVPGLMLGEIFGEIPQVFVAGSETDPAMFSNDESRVKVRHFLVAGVADFRPLHKSNVAP